MSSIAEHPQISPPPIYKSDMTKEQWKEAVKFTSLDFGWVIIGIGGAIGAGIVFLPIQVGLQGMWIFLSAAIFGYPALYMFQKLFIQTMLKSKTYEDYPTTLAEYIGKNKAAFISALYFIFLIIYMFVYSTVLNNDSVSFMDTFGVTHKMGLETGELARNPLYGLVIICLLVLIGSRGERALMRISTLMVLVKLGVVITLGVLMIPRWDIANFAAMPDMWTMVKGTIIMMPFTMVSILIIQSLAPMIISYRTKYQSLEVATHRGMRAFNITYFILLCTVIFFTLSFNLGLNQTEIQEAYANNISAVALVARSADALAIKVFGLILNIFAVVTAYIAVSMSFRDISKGLAFNALGRIMPTEKINKSVINLGISIFTIIVCWLVIILNAPVLSFTSIGSPIMGTVGCLVPAYVAYTSPAMKEYRTPRLWYILLAGFMLVISPFLAFS